ncbi:hypothetical protein C8R44DRAFT_818723 [Mycena epipterygia]|nr:hypothetical protein C8R44DRAFT_818723 [Mycena epipterygia]
MSDKMCLEIKWGRRTRWKNEAKIGRVVLSILARTCTRPEARRRRAGQVALPHRALLRRPYCFIYHIPLPAPSFPPHSLVYLASGHVRYMNARDEFPVQVMRAPRLVFAGGGRRMGRLGGYARCQPRPAYARSWRRRHSASSLQRPTCGASSPPPRRALSYPRSTWSGHTRDRCPAQRTPLLLLSSQRTLPLVIVQDNVCLLSDCISYPGCAYAGDGGWGWMGTRSAIYVRGFLALNPLAAPPIVARVLPRFRARRPARPS